MWIAETACARVESVSLWLKALGPALLITLVLDAIHSDSLNVCQGEEALVPRRQPMDHHRHPPEVKVVPILFFSLFLGGGGRVGDEGRQTKVCCWVFFFIYRMID